MHRSPRLWLVRHGQSAGNVARDQAEASGADIIELTTRDADVPLSPWVDAKPTHWPDLAGLPEDARPQRLMTSPLVRSVQTCVALAFALGIDAECVHVDERLRAR